MIGDMEEDLWRLRRKVEDNEKTEAFREMMDERKAETLVESKRKIVELEKKLEDASEVRNPLFDQDLSMPQLDWTSDAPGSVDFEGWGDHRSSSHSVGFTEIVVVKYCFTSLFCTNRH